MKVLFINEACGIGSHGRICAQKAEAFEAAGDSCFIAYGRYSFVPPEYRKYGVRIGSDLGVRLAGIETRLFDNHGLASRAATRKFLKWAEEYSPDLVWLHNLHGYYINYPMLFSWIKKHPDMQVRWTLHDCWSFTGHCAHFSYAKCDRWKTQCFGCPEKKSYPASFLLDRSRRNYRKKKEAFTGVKRMELIVPSKWLGDLVKESFLSEYPVTVEYNHIDEEVFQKTESNFREKYDLNEKRIILGVAGDWTKRKGLEDYFRLAEELQGHFKVVLVGLKDYQIKDVPSNILALSKTESPKELAGIYSSADVFVNLTYEDTYPTVNLEAKACGTPIITYDTGGCRETVSDYEKADIVKTGDLEAVIRILDAKFG